MSESPTHLSAQYTVMMEAVYESFYEEIVDFVILDECFECHRALKLGYFFLEEEPKPVQKIKVADDIDIFGQDTSKLKFPHIICPQCQLKQEATSFAPHLNRCMGMRRESSKVACKRLAAVNDPDSDFDDNENDDDFGYNSNRKRMKKKQGRNSPRRITKIKGKNWESSLLGASSNPSANHQEMTYDEKKTFLSQMCGVISKNTKKLCTKTQKCSLHTDEQRRDVRHSLLGSYTCDQLADDVQIDVDTVDEGSSSLNRFWDQTISRSPSPPPENIPTTSTSKIMSKSTIYHRKRKSLGPSNSVYGLKSSSAGSSFDPLEEHSN